MELQTVFDFIYQTLSGDATLQADVSTRIYEDEAPLEAGYPLIIISVTNGDDISGVNNERCVVTCEVLIYVVGTGNDTARLLRITNRIDALLHNNKSQPALSIMRSRPYRASGWVNGTYYKNFGGFYAVETGV